MNEEKRVELIKSICRTYYLAELNAQFVGPELTQRLDRDLESLMTKEEQDLFFTSNEFQGVPWDVVGV